MTALAIWSLVKRFWPAIPILGLLAALFIMSEDLKGKKADLKVAQQQVADVTAANKADMAALAAAQAQRADNDAIAATVASQLQGNIVTQNTTRTIIEKAIASDPKAANWADQPLPDSLRNALRSGQASSATP